MFEFKFDNQENYKGMEQDIKSYNKKDNIHFIGKVGIVSAFGGTFATLATTLNTSGIDPSISIATGAIMGSVISALALESIIKLVNNTKRNKAKKNLDTIVNSCRKNNLLTNSNNLSESIIIKQSNKESKIVTDEDITTSKESIVNDNYYLFLDSNEQLSGILERKSSNSNNDETFDETSYYILENEDIKPLENRVLQVKKLVRKPKDN